MPDSNTSINQLSAVVILANGSFPTHEYPSQVLTEAEFLICTDGSADKAIAHDLKPDLIIGDLDSTRLTGKESPYNIIQVADQNSTDLEKALDWSVKNRILKVSLVGISGERDDHTLTNYLVATHFSKYLEIQIITDFSTMDFCSGKCHFKSIPGQIVSLLNFEKIQSVTTWGLKFHLSNAVLEPSGRGMSNQALSDEFVVKSSSPLLVIRNHI